MNFERILKEVVWCLLTEGGVSHRRIKLRFGLDDDALAELRRVLIGIKRIAAHRVTKENVGEFVE